MSPQPSIYDPLAAITTHINPEMIVVAAVPV